MQKFRMEVTFETDQSKTTAAYRIEQAAKNLDVEGCDLVGEPRIVTVKERTDKVAAKAVKL